jgi:periplasmic divalent cation tolerance protein
VSGCLSVYVTAADRAEAETLGRVLVEERLAACANVLGDTISFYRWEGAVQRDDEVALLLKTRETLFEPLRARIRELHGYDLPCIVAWSIADGDAGYLDWIRAQTRRP